MDRRSSTAQPFNAADARMLRRLCDKLEPAEALELRSYIAALERVAECADDICEEIHYGEFRERSRARLSNALLDLQQRLPARVPKPIKPAKPTYRVTP